MIRVGLRTPSADPRAYRVIIEEIPQARPGGGVRVALRLNLPLFVMIEPGSPDALAWSAQAAPGGGWTIQAHNPTTFYIRPSLEEAGEAVGLRFEDIMNFGTILPGATRRWTVPANVQVADRARFDRIRRGSSDGAAAQISR